MPQENIAAATLRVRCALQLSVKNVADRARSVGLPKAIRNSLSDQRPNVPVEIRLI